jgi:hypothetical protein
VTESLFASFRLAANPPTFYANKRWGHGRSIQLLRRLRCIIRGHDFGRYNEGIRRCGNDCGGLTKRGDWRCSDCGKWSGPFGDLTGWQIGHGFLWCPDCAEKHP